MYTYISLADENCFISSSLYNYMFTYIYLKIQSTTLIERANTHIGSYCVTLLDLPFFSICTRLFLNPQLTIPVCIWYSRLALENCVTCRDHWVWEAVFSQLSSICIHPQCVVSFILDANELGSQFYFDRKTLTIHS